MLHYMGNLVITRLLVTRCVNRSRVNAMIIMRTKGFKARESFLKSEGTTYFEDMYRTWFKDANSVHQSWHSYFKQIKDSPTAVVAISKAEGKSQPTKTEPDQTAADALDEVITSHHNVTSIIRSYQVRGHLLADLDPLGIETRDTRDPVTGLPSAVVMRGHMKGLTTEDMNKVYQLPHDTFIGGGENYLPLREIIARMEDSYCNKIGAEFMFTSDLNTSHFLRKKFETPGTRKQSPQTKKLFLKRLIQATAFEGFLAKKWPSEKRFGLEGCDSFIPALKHIIDRASSQGVDTFVIGMAHRGRLNVLVNVCRVPFVALFSQFSALKMLKETGSGDNKYHLGANTQYVNRASNKKLNISIVANPSHLEAVNPVVEGKVRAHQFFTDDKKGEKTMAIVVHGDAAFCGQGVVYESIHLSNLPFYTTHGTIHMVINNQIGFTTDPRYSRSSPYCTDVAKVIAAPIFHVNAEDPESVIHCCNVAVDTRTTYKINVVLDIVGYRRMGHNEVDEPMFTQPIMYKKIKAKKPFVIMYTNQLLSEGLVTETEVSDMYEAYNNSCTAHYNEAQGATAVDMKHWMDSPWHGFFEESDPLLLVKTGIKEEIIQHIGQKISSSPPPELKFELHRGIERALGHRMELVKNRQADIALAEAMAFGSLLGLNYHVRLSGEDVERGTFSHRHHIYHDQSKDKTIYSPLSRLYPKQAKYTICNSSISEYAVLGFELGYSIVDPHSLVIWEAQFGDFYNSGQVIIDQFLSSGEAKWWRQTGLVLLLPHGYEGQGPEHSSARLERFLQQTTDDHDDLSQNGMDDPNFVINQLRSINWFVVNYTTPANYFHVLRRQVTLPFRKPLIIFSPKSLLRHPEVISNFDDMIEGTEFKRMIPEDGPASKNPKGVKKLTFCSGKVYFDIKKARDEKNRTEQIAIARIEQLAPFPYDLVRAECMKYPGAELCWVQEEPKNMGAWTYIVPRVAASVVKIESATNITYIGRRTAAAPVTGLVYPYKREFTKLMTEATSLRY